MKHQKEPEILLFNSYEKIFVHVEKVNSKRSVNNPRNNTEVVPTFKHRKFKDSPTNLGVMSSEKYFDAKNFHDHVIINLSPPLSFPDINAMGYYI